MTRPRKRLTAAFVRKAPPGKHGDLSNGLYLLVKPSGSRSWIQRIAIHGKRRDLGLGSADLVTLAEAREAAYENRRIARSGGDPVAERRKAAAPTFRIAAERTFEAHRSGWKAGNGRADNWMRRLERHAMPKLADVPVNAIGREHVLRVLAPIWTEKPETARKVRQAMKATFAWCIANQHMDGDNPAGESISGALKPQPSVKAHFRALPYDDLPDVLAAVEAFDRATVNARLAFRFAALTVARSGEVRGARWSEIDLDARVWTVPPERMKAASPHRVPLSDAAMAVLDQAAELGGRRGLVFPAPADASRTMSDATLTRMLDRAGLKDRMTVHGLRSTFRDWAAEQTNADYAVMETCLAHTVGSAVERAYARSDLLAKRRLLMDRWARHCTRTAGEVVRIPTAS